MKTKRLARMLGLDGNPLRPRTDRIAACLAVLLVTAFLAAAPLLSMAAIGWAGHDGVTAQHLRLPVPAVRAIPPRMGAMDLPPGAPPSGSPPLGFEAAAVILIPSMLGLALLCLAWAGRRVLDRRRLAAWEAAWADVGPQWTGASGHGASAAPCPPARRARGVQAERLAKGLLRIRRRCRKGGEHEGQR